MMRRVAIRLLLLLVFILVWELSYRAHMLNPIIIGSPSLVWAAMQKDGGTFLAALRLTAGEIAFALVVSYVCGIVFGVVAGSFRFLSRLSAPLLSAIMAIPFVVLYPVMMAWFTVGPPSKIAFGIVLGFFPIALNTMIGIRGIDRGFATMATAMGASRLQVLMRVKIPLALPAVISGLRLGTSLVIVAIILAEMLASLGGLGYWISYHRSIFNTGQVYLGIILVLVLTGVINSLLSLLDRRFGRWRSLQQQGF